MKMMSAFRRRHNEDLSYFLFSFHFWILKFTILQLGHVHNALWNCSTLYFWHTKIIFSVIFLYFHSSILFFCWSLHIFLYSPQFAIAHSFSFFHFLFFFFRKIKIFHHNKTPQNKKKKKHTQNWFGRQWLCHNVQSALVSVFR